MLILRYESKKVLKENIGKRLKFSETSMFGPEFSDNGKFCGSNRPSITGIKNSKTGRPAGEFFAEVTMVNGLISKVS